MFRQGIIMVKKYRCDSCKKIYLENELTKIMDEKGRAWCRCNKCTKKCGTKSRGIGYYAYIQYEGAMGLEDPKKVVGYGPCNCKKH